MITAITKSRFILTNENVVYLLIPALEFVLAMAMILPRTRFKALVVAAMILLLWTICNGYRVVTGAQLPFSYGGLHESFTWMEHFYLVVPMLLLSCMSITLFLINSYHDSRSSRIPV